MKSALFCLVTCVALSSSACQCSDSRPLEKGPALTPDMTCFEPACLEFGGRVFGELPRVVKGADFDLSTDPCELFVAWDVGPPSAVRFQAKMYPFPGDILPLPEGFAKMQFCLGVRQGPTGARRPVAGVWTEPEVALPALAPDDVFIPLRGEATLNGNLYTHAVIEQRGPTHGVPLSVRIGIAARGKGSSFEGLHEGDTFTWGDYHATVVHIVVSVDGVSGTLDDGWIEVNLSNPSWPSNPDR